MVIFHCIIVLSNILMIYTLFNFLSVKGVFREIFLNNPYLGTLLKGLRKREDLCKLWVSMSTLVRVIRFFVFEMS